VLIVPENSLLALARAAHAAHRQRGSVRCSFFYRSLHLFSNG
jgi:hypothetical protein